MKKMSLLPRIVLSVLMLTMVASCATEDSAVNDDVDTVVLAVTAPDPCGLWIASTPSLAEVRHLSAPTNADMVQLALPGGLSCVALIMAVPAVEASWGGGHAVVHYIHAPGIVADNEPDLAHTSIDIYLEGVGWTHWENGIGTSPSEPMDGENLKPTADTSEDDLYMKCKQWVQYVCETPNGLPALCRYCGCTQICSRDPYTGREICDNDGCF